MWGYESPTQAASGDTVVRMGREKYLSMTVETSPTSNSPAVWLHINTSHPVPVGSDILGWCGRAVRWRRELRSRGRRSRRVEDQLDVSEWTLPGPSVGEVTDEGVGASCQPPFAWEQRGERHWGSLLLPYTSVDAAKVRPMEVLRARQRFSAAWNAGIRAAIPLRTNTPLNCRKSHSKWSFQNQTDIKNTSNWAETESDQKLYPKNKAMKIHDGCVGFYLEINACRCHL